MTTEANRPGLEGVIAGETAVSTLEGGLLYRGYPIEELAERATFAEVAYLLLHGERASEGELRGFIARVAAAAALPQPIWATLRQLPKSANSMDVLRSGVSLLAHFDPETGDLSAAANLRKAERLLGQISVLLAGWWRIRQGQQPVEYSAQSSLAANLLRMIHGDEPEPNEVRALDVSLILYAEHEFNASTFTARVVAGTMSDLHSAITAAIGALKGPLHGGANEQVLAVLESIGNPEQAEPWIRAALAAKRRVMGFGHRIYKVRDPRAEYLKILCAQLAEARGNLELEHMAETIERVMRAEKRLPPNLDWPSARLYYYLRLPVELYTPLFVASRVTGWSAHVLEQLANNRLIRPEARYVGQALRHWPGSCA